MKKLLYVAVGLLSMASLASCGVQNNDEKFTPTLDKEMRCDIKVVGDYSNFEALEAEFDLFNKYYPNVRLTYQKVDNYNNSLGTVLESNDKPNIFCSSPSMMGNEKYSNIISHMEDLSDPALKFNFDCLRSGLINKDGSGKVYMVPIFSRTYGMLVNNDLFKKENINVPEKWSDLLSACASFASKSYNPIMGYTKDKKPSSGLMNVIAYPQFVAELAKNPDALAKANNLDPSAGEYMRNSLTLVKNLVDRGAINVSKCDEIGDNYEKVLLRFFEGDVPMMVCNGDTVSGAKKREAKSEAYQANPFNYSFYPIPVTDKGGYFIDSPSLEFSVNKDCENLDMTNEFMRFLLRTKELQNMASLKGLIPSTKSTSFDAVYAPFGKVPSDRTISPEVIGVKDQLATQIRLAAYKVGKGELSIDEAVKQYGSLE